MSANYWTRARYYHWLCLGCVNLLGCTAAPSGSPDGEIEETLTPANTASSQPAVSGSGAIGSSTKAATSAPAAGSGGRSGPAQASAGATGAVPPAAAGATGGATGGAGQTARAGASAAAGSGTTGATGTAGAAGTAGTAGAPASTLDKFSFFVTSYAAIQRLSGSTDGFGGDLRYGEADGLTGADKICTEIAEGSMPGAGAKGWHAFLSVTKGPTGQPIHAADRIGQGPWYDRLGRLVAQTCADVLNSRPKGADAAIIDDLPNEEGVPNHAPDGSEQVDNHDVLTGTNDKGQLFDSDWAFTCHDWTSSQGADGTPRVGHSWPRSGGPGGGGPGGPGGWTPPGGGAPGGGGPGGGMNGPGDMANWMSALNEAGCAAGASLVEMGPPDPDNPTVGSGGGYGAIYCFALQP